MCIRDRPWRGSRQIRCGGRVAHEPEAALDRSGQDAAGAGDLWVMPVQAGLKTRAQVVGQPGSGKGGGVALQETLAQSPAAGAQDDPEIDDCRRDGSAVIQVCPQGDPLQMGVQVAGPTPDLGSQQGPCGRAARCV